MGNSIFEGLYYFGIIKKGKFLTQVGLNVSTVYTKKMDGSDVTVINELKKAEYGKVIINFGTNELGWPSQNTFFNKYSKLIDDVREMQPDAAIFIVGILPVTKKYNDGKGQENGITNDRAIKANERLEELASGKEGCYYIDVPDEMYDKNGCLPADSSPDGVHLNLAFDRIWAAHICQRVTEYLK